MMHWRLRVYQMPMRPATARQIFHAYGRCYGDEFGGRSKKVRARGCEGGFSRTTDSLVIYGGTGLFPAVQ